MLAQRTAHLLELMAGSDVDSRPFTEVAPSRTASHQRHPLDEVAGVLIAWRRTVTELSEH